MSSSRTSRVHYLVAYNTFCLALWILVAFNAVVHWRAPAWFDHLGRIVTLAMTMALLEVAHATLGLVKSDPVTTLMQVCSRLHVCYFIWGNLPETRTMWSTRIVLVAWTLSELCRYPMYIYQLINPAKTPAVVKWLRYSAFIVLYPLGILGEIVTMAKAVVLFSKLDKFRHWPVAMPNRLNFETNLGMIYIWTIAGYVPGSVHMFMHMYRQRKRVLSDARAKST